MARSLAVEKRLRLVRSISDPASKAYLVGYLLDLVPALLKAVLRFVTREIKRITALQRRASEERKAARESGHQRHPDSVSEGRVDPWSDIVLPILQNLPNLLKDFTRAIGSAFSPKGMASACAAAILGWALLDELLSSVLVGTVASQRRVAAIDRGARIQLLRIWSCFIAAALSSGTALMVLQSASASQDGRPSIKEPSVPLSPTESFNNLKRSVVAKLSSNGPSGSDPPKGLATPLAPGGHFLARLTSLSIPATPKADGSRSPIARHVPLLDSGVAAPNVTPLSSTDTPAELPASINEIRDVATQSAAKVQRDKSSGATALGRPSPTVDLTLFALVRGLDTFVRAAPLFLGRGSNPRKVAPKSPAASTTSTAPSASFSSRIIGKGRSREALGSSLGSGHRLRQRQALALSGASSFLAKLRAGAANQAEGITFVLCCAVIMWSWFYAPERLPPTYVKWITNLATMDERLLLALRSIRTRSPHTWDYGSSTMTPAAVDLLGSMSESLGYPYEWGDPSRLPASAVDARKLLQRAKVENAKARSEGRNPELEDKLRPPGGEPGYVLAGAAGPRGRGEMGGMPCEIVHCGVGGSSCLANAGLRWIRGWKVCMGIYVPVHLLPRLLFNPSQFAKKPLEAITKVLVGSARSASFLATYIASIW